MQEVLHVDKFCSRNFRKIDFMDIPRVKRINFSESDSESMSFTADNVKFPLQMHFPNFLVPFPSVIS